MTENPDSVRERTSREQDAKLDGLIHAVATTAQALVTDDYEDAGAPGRIATDNAAYEDALSELHEYIAELRSHSVAPSAPPPTFVERQRAARLCAMVHQLTDQLEDEVNAQYGGPDNVDPRRRHKYVGDMDNVRRARELLAEMVAPSAPVADATFDISQPTPLCSIERVMDMSLPCPACNSDGGSCSLCKGSVMRRTYLSDTPRGGDAPESTSADGLPVSLREEVRDKIGDEIADVLLLTFQIARRQNIDVAAAIRGKLAILRTRTYGAPNAEGWRQHVTPNCGHAWHACSRPEFCEYHRDRPCPDCGAKRDAPTTDQSAAREESET